MYSSWLIRSISFLHKNQGVKMVFLVWKWSSETGLKASD